MAFISFVQFFVYRLCKGTNFLLSTVRLSSLYRGYSIHTDLSSCQQVRMQLITINHIPITSWKTFAACRDCFAIQVVNFDQYDLMNPLVKRKDWFIYIYISRDRKSVV